MTQKERIVEQAMRMFATQGIKAVRMDDIARQLGVSKAAVARRLRRVRATCSRPSSWS